MKLNPNILFILSSILFPSISWTEELPTIDVNVGWIYDESAPLSNYGINEIDYLNFLAVDPHRFTRYDRPAGYGGPLYVVKAEQPIVIHNISAGRNATFSKPIKKSQDQIDGSEVAKKITIKVYRMDPDYTFIPKPAAPIKTFFRSTKLQEAPKTSTDTYSAEISYTLPAEPGVRYRISRSLDGVTFYDYDVYLEQANITVRKKGTSDSPSLGLIVKKGDTVEMALAPHFFDQVQMCEPLIKWELCQLKGDGSYTNWDPINDDAKGLKYERETSAAGIYRIRAVVTNTGGGDPRTFEYVRKKDAENATDSFGVYNEKYRKGQPDFVGIVSNDQQRAIRENALGDLGKDKYAQSKYLAPYKNRPEFRSATLPDDPGANKCNAFVYDKAEDAGIFVPLIRGHVWNLSPPLAYDWFDPATFISGWTSRPVGTCYPEPGWVIGRPDPQAPAGSTDAHCGILDYDGSWLNAGRESVNKKPHLSDDDYKLPYGFKTNTATVP